jgi:hypothetical protein
VSTIVISSGVHVGAKGAGSISQDWFSGTPTEQFSDITLQLVSSQFLISAEGRLGDRDPVLLNFQGRGLASTYDTLKTIETIDVMNGRPRATLSGFLDVVAFRGFLVNVQAQLWADSQSRNAWGILTQVRNQVGDRGWTVQAVFMPCGLLWRRDISAVYVDPATYDTLDGGS